MIDFGIHAVPKGGHEPLTLAPFSGLHPPSLIARAVRRDPEDLLNRIVQEGLAPLWSQWSDESGSSCSLPETFRSRLRHERRNAAALHLLQRATMARAAASLNGARVPYALFKGAAVRERLYDDPSVRPAADLDVLIPPEARDRALRTLVAAGFRFLGSRATVSHEVSLRYNCVDLDLHWCLYRPGRSRIELRSALLETVVETDGTPVLKDDANLLVMLVHPAFAKHVNGRGARLVRVVDLDRMLRIRSPNWDWILPLIDAAGLRTAAWAVLHWQRLLMDSPVDASVLRHLEPGSFHRQYLRFWIERQLAARLGGIPGLVQGAFTLALHDRPGDGVRAVVQLVKAMAEAGWTLDRLQRLTEPGD